MEDDDDHVLSVVNRPVPNIAALPDYNENVVRVHLVNARLTAVDESLLQLTKLQSLQLPKQFFDEAAQRGEVHFVVGKKLGCHSTARPCHKGFLNYPRSTLYDYNEVLLEGDPLWS